MKNKLLLALNLFMFSFLVEAQEEKWVKGEVYIKIKEKAFKQARLNSSQEREVTSQDLETELPFLSKNVRNYNLKNIQRSFYFSSSTSLRRIYRVTFEDDSKVDSLIKVISKNPMIEYIERVPLFKTNHDLSEKNYTNLNSLLSDDWHLQKIKAYDTWNIAPKPVREVIVAVVDNAIQTTHPDLVDNLVPFWRDVGDDDKNPNPLNASKSHGTHVAGIIAARNNNIGISSVSNNRVKIMPIKFAGDLSASTEDELDKWQIEGIVLAADNSEKAGHVQYPVSIINMSFKAYHFTNALKDALDLAINNNIILVGAAGNSNNEVLYYPASYQGVISVANTDENDTRHETSSYNRLVDISAPGTNIKSTVPFDLYDYATGTSMSSPLVSGAIGYLLSYLPFATRDEIETLIKNSADNIDAANPDYIGKLGTGRLNLLKAVQQSMTNNAPTLIPNLNNSTNFTWNQVAGCHAFVVERATNSIGPYFMVGDVLKSTTTTYTDNTTLPNTNYYYRVRCSNSNNYSNTITTGCLPTYETVSLYNNSYNVNQKAAWFKSYAAKVLKWNLADKNKTGNLTVGEASKSVILAAKAIWNSKYTTLPKPCFDQSEYAAYVQEMKRIGVLSQSATANDPMNLDILSDMIFKVILDAGAAKDEVMALPSVFIRNNSRYTGTAKAKKLANIGTIRFMGINPTTGRPIPSVEFMLEAKQTINRNVFYKVLTGAYENKYLVVNSQLRQGRISSELAITSVDLNDIATLGYKPEYDDDVSEGEPTLQLTGTSEVIQSGAQWWIQVNPSLLGNNQQFYWTVEGALQGARLDMYSGYPNHQRVYFTAPTVSTETIVNMVIYGGSDDGKAVEIFKQFKVIPISSNACFTLLTPNITIDKVAGSFSDPKSCMFKNGSASSSANLTFQITGPNASSFSRSSSNLSLSPNQISSISINCDAATVGTYIATLEITQTGLNGCPQKTNVPLLAKVTAATSEPNLSWIAPTAGATFYSGALPTMGIPNYTATNNSFGGMEVQYTTNGINWTTLTGYSCINNNVFTPIFPAGTFAVSARMRIRKKDCTFNQYTGNWVESPTFKIISTPNTNINIALPNGQEVLTGGQLYEIQWSGSSTGAVTLQYSTDGGATFPYTIASGLSASIGKYTWIIPTLSGYENDVKIKIISGQYSDVSDADFEIKPPMSLSPTVKQGCDEKGQIIVNAGGGKGPVTYLLTPGNYTSNDIAGLTAGTYTLKITDQTGESLQTTVIVPAYTPRDFTYTKTDATCGGRNGSIKVTGFSSGFVPISTILYKKDGLQNTAITFNGEANNLEAGRYELYVGNLGGCGVTKIIDISPDNNFSVTSVVANASCGQNDGAISLTPSSSATYIWSNGATTNTLNNLQQGTYFVTIRNTTTGCNLPFSFDVGQKPNINVSQAQTFNNVLSNQMVVSEGNVLFIKPNSMSILRYNSSNLTQFQEHNILPNENLQSLKEIHFKYSFPPSPSSTIGFVALNTSNQYYVGTYDFSSNSLYSQGLFNNSVKKFGYTGGPNSFIVAHLQSNSIVNALGNQVLSGGSFNSVNFNTHFDFLALDVSNDKVYKVNNFLIQEAIQLSSPPLKAFGGLDINAVITTQGTNYKLGIYKKDNNNTLDYELVLQLTTSDGNLTDELIGDQGDYLLIPTVNGKVAVFSKSRKSIINVVDLGMSISKVGYDTVTKRFFFFGNNTLKHLTITEPNLSVSYTKTDVSCSQAGSISLTVSGGGTPTYSWSNGTSTKNITNLSSNTYTVTVTPSDGGCAVKKSVKIENIGVNSTAAITSPSNQTSFCAGENLQLAANQGDGLTYQWQKDGVDVSGATQQTYYVTLSGAYRVKVKNTTGCETTSSSLTITSKPLPTATITPLSSTTICQGSSVTLRANAATNQTYIWVKEGVVAQGQTSQNFIANAGGSYQVVTTLNGCSNISGASAVSENPLPEPPTINPVSISSGQMATLTASNCGGIVNWYSATTGSNFIISGISYTTPALTINTIYYATCTVSGCESTTRSSGIVTVSPAGNPCPPTITHSTGVLPAGTYQAGQTIDSKANISSPTTFIAGQSILLTNGFSAGPNETFLAKIEGCNTNTIPTNGLVAYFSLDGNANDTGGNTGTVSGATLTTDRKGVANKAYSFDGNDKITATDNNLPTGNTPRTFSIWVYSSGQQSNTTPATLLSYGTPSSNTNHCSFVMWGNKLRFSNWSGAPDIDYTYFHSVNQWFHLVVKLDESNVVKIYINGALQHTSSVMETWNTVKNGQLIFGENLVQGKLDEIRIYNRAITDAEVLQIYNAEKP